MASTAVQRAAAQMNRRTGQELFQQATGVELDQHGKPNFNLPGQVSAESLLSDDSDFTGTGTGTGMSGVPGSGDVTAPGGVSRTGEVAEALARYGVPPGMGMVTQLPWNTQTQGLAESTLGYDLSGAYELGFSRKGQRNWPEYRDKFVEAERRIAQAGLAPASRRYILDRIHLGIAGLGHDRSSKDVNEVFDQFVSDEALRNFAEMDQASRMISEGIAQSRAPIDAAERDYTTRQAAMQAAIAPQVSRLVAQGGGEDSLAGQAARALQWQQVAQAPDFAAERIKARDQILNDPVIGAARIDLATRGATYGQDIAAAIDEYRRQRFTDASGGVQPLRLGPSQNHAPPTTVSPFGN